MSELLQQLLDARANQGTEQDPIKLAIERLRNSLFDKQLDVINDPASYKVLCCSRRAGKTSLLARYLLMKALQQSGGETLYLATTAKSAKEIVWDGPSGIPAIVRKLGLERFCTLNETKSSITFSNGHVLHVSGAESKDDAARWLGHAYDLVVIDESQSFRDEILEYAIGTVILPALLDRKGELILAGTPKPLCAGVFYDASTGVQQGWSRHAWTVFENKKLKDADRWVADECKRLGEKPEDPNPQRQYWGRWVREESAQLFQYLPGRNDFVGLPSCDANHRPIDWQYVLGFDLGHRDLTAFALIAWSQQLPTVYCLETMGIAKAIDEDVARVIKNYQLRYHGKYLKLVADAGGLGKMIIEGLKARHGFVIEPALKTEKAGAIRLMNSAMRKGDLMFKQETCRPLLDQYQKLEIDPRTEIERPQDPCDFADAALYAWRWTYAYTYQAPKVKPTEQQAQLEAVLAAYARTEKQFPSGDMDAMIDREMEAYEEGLSEDWI